jgi:membrane-bound lytic murein transglycosylase B
VEKPRCRLSWATLAGVGWVESQHGTFGGRTLGVDGRPGLTPIFGVPLSGVGPVAYVADTDGGRIDGDSRYDRAVGPMQFVPSAWRTWGSDGDGDGAADPQDVFDAAYSAGRYLCAAGLPLKSAIAWSRAVLSYNPSATYLRDVLAAANAYASRSTG